MGPFNINDVVFSAQAASILEVSVDKPGNVGPSHDFADTRFEDFLLSGIGIGKTCRSAVEFGMSLKSGKTGIGSLIKSAIVDSRRWNQGKNTNLGISMLLIPLSASAGICIGNNSFSINDLRTNVSKIIDGSTSQDTLDLYDAIIIAEAEVGRSRQFDVKDPNSRKKVIEKDLNLRDIFSISKWDAIARELVTDMEVTFSIGYPALKNEYIRSRDIRPSILKCFFEILSSTPDALIERKTDRDMAVKISDRAREILDKGLEKGEVAEFGARLRRDGNRYNPGTTADLTASSIMVGLLDGLLI